MERHAVSYTEKRSQGAAISKESSPPRRVCRPCRAGRSRMRSVEAADDAVATLIELKTMWRTVPAAASRRQLSRTLSRGNRRCVLRLSSKVELRADESTSFPAQHITPLKCVAATRRQQAASRRLSAVACCGSSPRRRAAPAAARPCRRCPAARQTSTAHRQSAVACCGSSRRRRAAPAAARPCRRCQAARQTSTFNKHGNLSHEQPSRRGHASQHRPRRRPRMTWPRPGGASKAAPYHHHHASPIIQRQSRVALAGGGGEGGVVTSGGTEARARVLRAG